MIHQANIELEIHRCLKCGRWYAHEQRHGCNCPNCMQLENIHAADENRRLERVIRGLRGTLKRKRGSQ